MFLNKHINLRITERHYNEIERIVEKNRDKYDNAAHYIRCAIIKTLREEK